MTGYEQTSVMLIEAQPSPPLWLHDLAAGDTEGCVTWRRVERALKELLDDRPPGEGEAVH